MMRQHLVLKMLSCNTGKKCSYIHQKLNNNVMNSKIDWYNILKRIVTELPVSQVLKDNNITFHFRYILIKEEERLGYLLIWEEKSKRAVQISRVKAPINFPALYPREDNHKFEKEIPNNLKYEDVNSSEDSITYTF